MKRQQTVMVTLLTIVVLCLAVGSRLEFLAHWAVNFDSDEALVGLQARDIQHGKFALYLPGQDYMGSLQGILAAPFLAIIGEHPNVIRISPLLWILPGLLALLALERLGTGSLGRGRGARFVACQWLCSPAVLFLAGVKARGGYLESLVLGFWMMALLWPRAGRCHTRSQSLRWSIGGLFLGLGLWTHEQILLFLPLVFACLVLEAGSRLRRSVGFSLGFILGYLPLWLPRIAPMSLGPPGMSGLDLNIEPAFMFSLEAIKKIPEILIAPLTSGIRPGGIAMIVQVVYVTLMLSGAALSIWLWARNSQRSPLKDTTTDIDSKATQSQPNILFWRASPAFIVSLWLAIATVASLLLMPNSFDDSHWFRYTLGITPFFVLSAASILYRLPGRLAVPIAIVLALLATGVSREAVSDWGYPYRGKRVALIQALEKNQVTRVVTDWNLAYFVRFMTGDSILCSSQTPIRYPDVNAQVSLAPKACTISSYPVRRRHGVIDTLFADTFSSISRRFNPPPLASETFVTLDLSRTLFPDYEPYPLLPHRSFPVDWRGWPYQRPLSEFLSIVWQPKKLGNQPELREQIETCLCGLVNRGEFTEAAQWAGNRILIRQSLP